MNQSKLSLVIVFFLTFAINLFSQSVELKYRERTIGSDLSIQIYFSDEYGSEDVSPDSIAKSDNFYFCFKPIGDWTFTEKNIKRYVDPIKLKQNDSTITYLSRNSIRDGKSITKYVLSYKKIIWTISVNLILRMS